MAKLSLLAKLTCAEGQNEAFEQALKELVEASVEETGLEIYSVHRAGDSDDYYFFELYSDDEAWAAHGQGELMQAAMGSVGALLAVPAELTMMTPVAAKGLDL